MSTKGIFSKKRAFAIKEIHTNNDKDRLLVETELSLLKRCNHPNIVKLVEGYRIRQEPFDNTLFLVMDPWAPVSLQRCLENVSDAGTSSLCPW
jgi:serine/threonine protein kinase